MAGQIIGGPFSWGAEYDDDGFVEYRVGYRVKVDAGDGPAVARQTPGLPLPGSFYAVDNDVDFFATCKQRVSVKEVHENEPGDFFELTFAFTTKSDTKSCKDQQIQDPLLEPMKVSGTFVRAKEEATRDRFGRPLTTSSHEVLRGPQVEFDRNKPQIKIEQNVAYLGLEVFGPMIDTLNAFPLWGLPPRTIKLSNVPWERKFYGQCHVYYTRTLEFEIDVKLDPLTGLAVSGWDREVLDEGTKALWGRWEDGEWVLNQISGIDPRRDNPLHFQRYQDANGNTARILLDGKGVPYTPKPPKTASCDQCPDGTPLTWQVVGLRSPATGASLTLTVAGGPLCDWEGSPNNDPDKGLATFEYDDVTDSWVLAFLATTWSIDDEDFDCMGPNRLLKDLQAMAGPDELLIQPGGAGTPGRIRVEKYAESDFLLLGVPLQF